VCVCAHVRAACLVDGAELVYKHCASVRSVCVCKAVSDSKLNACDLNWIWRQHISCNQNLAFISDLL
jgi:hypothetical protein